MIAPFRRLLPFCLLVLPAGGLAAAWFLTDDDVDSLSAGGAPVLSAPTARQVTGSQPVSLTLTWDEGRELISPGWNGVVTAVDVAPGDALVSGQQVAVIDGVARLAFASTVPFHRPLKSGDEGPDVAAVHELLLALGEIDALPGTPAFYSFATSQAVRALETRLGIAPTTGVFDSAWVAWLPAPELVIGAVNLAVAAPASSPGSPFAAEAARITGVLVQPANASAPLAVEHGVPFVLRVGDLELPISEGGVLAESDYATLAGAVEPLAEQASGVVMRETPLDALAVPSTAIVTGPAGGLCAWVAQGTAYEARPVTVGDSRSGVTNIVTGLQPTDEVLANPAEVLEAPACP